MAHELNVWLFSDHVGTLALVDGRLSFCYHPTWLLHEHALALSASLPLQAEPFDDRQTRPFFAGLLPEGQVRRLIAQQFQVSGQNDFALLDHIGGECAGAVTLLAPGQILPTTNHDNHVQWLSDEEVVAILDELPHRPMLAGTDGLRLSLAGAQDKLPVAHWSTSPRHSQLTYFKASDSSDRRQRDQRSILHGTCADHAASAGQIDHSYRLESLFSTGRALRPTG
jgi:serine/threonine-protein kinase HipA